MVASVLHAMQYSTVSTRLLQQLILENVRLSETLFCAGPFGPTASVELRCKHVNGLSCALALVLSRTSNAMKCDIVV